jgi:DNA-binding NarL/FixJ family response regulator
MRGRPGQDGQPIRLAVVDDHPVIAAAIAAEAVASVADGRRIEVGATATSVGEALAMLEPGRVLPDVLLCDLQLGDRAEGLTVLDEAVRAGVPVIVLTAFDRSGFARAAFERGASGFLSKSLAVRSIIEAVRTVAEGGTVYSAAMLEAVRASREPSTREIQIVARVSRGATSQEIAHDLGISTRTVDSHLRRMFDRYGVVSRAELAVLAEREGWLSGAGE